MEGRVMRNALKRVKGHDGAVALMFLSIWVKKNLGYETSLYKKVWTQYVKKIQEELDTQKK